MLLTVDVGNTHIRLGVFPLDGGPLERTWSVRTSPSVTSDELALTVRGLLGECAERLEGISALSVVPSVTGELRRMAADYWPGLPSVVVAPGVKTGVPLLVDNPREVGSDRVVNALAAHSLFEGPVVVVAGDDREAVGELVEVKAHRSSGSNSGSVSSPWASKTTRTGMSQASSSSVAPAIRVDTRTPSSRSTSAKT